MCSMPRFPQEIADPEKMLASLKVNGDFPDPLIKVAFLGGNRWHCGGVNRPFRFSLSTGIQRGNEYLGKTVESLIV